MRTKKERERANAIEEIMTDEQKSMCATNTQRVTFASK